MRILFTVAALCVAAAAQSPLTTTFASNNGQSGNMFDLVAQNPQGVTINSFDVNVDPGTWDFEVYVLPAGQSFLPDAQNPLAWSKVGQFTGIVSAGTNVPTPLPNLCQPIFIPSGGTQAFYVTVTNGTAINYTTGTGFPSGSVYASNADLDYLAGSGNSYPFGSVFGPTTSSRIFNGNIYYDIGNTSGGTCSFASVTSFGLGCGGNAAGDTQYELFDAASPFDLGNTGQTYLWTGTGYVLTDGAGPIVTPVATPTTFTDDDTNPIAIGFAMPSPNGVVTDIALCSNGWFSFDSTVTDTDLSESIAEMVNDPYSRFAFLWDDLNPAAGGSITIDYVSATETLITYTDVPEFGTAAGANNCQIALFDTGTIEVRYGNCTLQDGMVGVSPGFGANDLGGTDYSAIGGNAILIETSVGPFFDALELVANSPVIGGNWDLTTNNIDPVSPVAITFLGDRSPVAIPLTSIGFPAPGCDAWLSSAVGALSAPNNGGSATVTVPVPNNPALTGQLFGAQSVALTLGNPANLVTTNGVEGTAGN